MEASLNNLLAKIPPENRHKLDWKIDSDIELAEISRKLTRWEEVLSYLGLKETDQEDISHNRSVDSQRLAPFMRYMIPQTYILEGR